MGRDWQEDIGDGERSVVNRSLAVQVVFVVFVIVLAWRPLEHLWHVSRTPAVDCVRVVDVAESRRGYMPMCMSAEELARRHLSPGAGLSQDDAAMLLIISVVIALGLVVAVVARVVPRIRAHQGLRIPD